MNKDFSIPPNSPNSLTPVDTLIERLSPLLGTTFKLTGKSRTDGSNVRKLIASTLEKYPLPCKAEEGEYEIVPPKNKGVPKICREFIDTYIVTTGSSYNLQVWNRLPASNTLLIKYESNESLKCEDVRFVIVRINPIKSIISSILILSADYIETRFGKFGVPTVKHQLLISSKTRQKIYQSGEKLMFYPDTERIKPYLSESLFTPKDLMINDPTLGNIIPLEILRPIFIKGLIDFKLEAAATKNRGQALERKVLELLGYHFNEGDLLYGAYPDIRNQLLEVKVQDSPTVDLGKYSPENEEIVLGGASPLTTYDVRYLIALTDSKTNRVHGLILTPGENLGDVFSYVSDQSYKCQRAIPMAFFEKYVGKIVFNPS